MRIRCTSGRTVEIPDEDFVFIPRGNYRPGDLIDPATVDFESEYAAACQPGTQVILDNRVEAVAGVT